MSARRAAACAVCQPVPIPRREGKAINRRAVHKSRTCLALRAGDCADDVRQYPTQKRDLRVSRPPDLSDKKIGTPEPYFTDASLLRRAGNLKPAYCGVRPRRSRSRGAIFPPRARRVASVCSVEVFVVTNGGPAAGPSSSLKLSQGAVMLRKLSKQISEWY
jgi:hypothetical protein